MTEILATSEAEIWRFMIGAQPSQIVCEMLSPKVTKAKWTGGLAQVIESLLQV
jgi:hypothetical protein